MNMEEEQPPAKKPQIGDSTRQQQQGSDEPNGMNVDEQNEVTETSTTMVDMPRPHRKLPAELNSQIYLCLNSAAQRKFIYGLGWDFYAMFRYKLLTKTKRLCNPSGNRWEGSKVCGGRGKSIFHAMALMPATSLIDRRMFGLQRDLPFPGQIVVRIAFPVQSCIISKSSYIAGHQLASRIWPFLIVDLLADLQILMPHMVILNTYFPTEISNILNYRKEPFDRNGKNSGMFTAAVLFLDPENKLAIFFTLNGKLLGRQISICPSVDRLFPAITIRNNYSIEANFGDDKDKPFLYDIKNCPGMDLPCF